MTGLREVQDQAWLNKIAQGFNTIDVHADIDRTRAELDEFQRAVDHGDSLDDQVEELADVVIFVAGLAQMIGADLQLAVAKKLQVNAGRRYLTDPVTGRRTKEA